MPYARRWRWHHERRGSTVRHGEEERRTSDRSSGPAAPAPEGGDGAVGSLAGGASPGSLPGSLPATASSNSLTAQTDGNSSPSGGDGSSSGGGGKGSRGSGDEGDGGSSSSGQLDPSNWWHDRRSESSDGGGDGGGRGPAAGAQGGAQGGSRSPVSDGGKSSSNSCLSAGDILQLGEELLDQV